MMTVLYFLLAGLFGVILLGILSQKGEAPGLINGRLKEPDSKPNVVCSEAGTQPERAVAPLKATLSQVAEAIEATGGTITSRSETYLSATYMSAIVKFVDDVEIRPEGDLCHIRSASRIGYSDMGVNRKRVEAIRSHLKSDVLLDT